MHIKNVIYNNIWLWIKNNLIYIYNLCKKIEIYADDVYKLIKVLDVYCQANSDCDEIEYLESLVATLLEKSLEVKQGLIKVGEDFLSKLCWTRLL